MNLRKLIECLVAALMSVFLVTILNDPILSIIIVGIIILIYNFLVNKISK